jgi:hypothetical protein
MREYRLVTFKTSRNERLYFPDTGVFAALVPAPTLYEYVICMPIHPQCALALLPKQIDHAAAGMHLSQESRLVISSVGTSLNCES